MLNELVRLGDDVEVPYPFHIRPDRQPRALNGLLKHVEGKYGIDLGESRRTLRYLLLVRSSPF